MSLLDYKKTLVSPVRTQEAIVSVPTINWQLFQPVAGCNVFKDPCRCIEVVAGVLLVLPSKFVPVVSTCDTLQIEGQKSWPDRLRELLLKQYRFTLTALRQLPCSLFLPQVRFKR